MGYNYIAIILIFGVHMKGKIEGVEAHEICSLIFNSIDDMVSFHDFSGKYLMVSPSCEKVLGYVPDEMLGKSAYDFVFEDDIEPLRAHHEVSLKNKSASRPIIFRAKKKNGEIIWFESYSRIIDGCAVNGIAVISRDITKRVQMEDALKKSEANFRELYENMSEGVAMHEVIFGDDGKTPINYKIIDVNPAFSKHTGLPRKNAKNILATDLYKTQQPPYLEEFCRVGITGKPYHFETYFPPMAKYFSISVISPSYGKFATVFEDITDRKKKEKELNDKNAEMERFVYTVSHDLKNPLITIKGFSGMLKKDFEKNDKAAIEDDIRRISMAADKMKNLLDDLLKLSKTGKVVGEFVEIDLKELIFDVQAGLSSLISDSGAKIILSDDLGIIKGDRQRIFEVFQNLIENSIKYSKKEIKPEIHIGHENIGNEKVFFVKDNGIGIENKYLYNIFGLFNKLNPETEGSGIGLALVKRIIEAHGGRVWAVSDGKSGTEICFTLPGIKQGG